MSDASPAEPAPGPSALDPTDGAKPVLTMTGYCADCGTWDAHGPTCTSCGYDFTGASTPAPRDQ